MRSCLIILFSTFAAVVYGVIHDQVTARVCVEYFTIGHPPVFDTTDPTLLGIGWGVIATWWVGLILGVPLALSARIGAWPKWDARRLLLPLVIMLAILGAFAVVAGVAGHVAAQRGWVVLSGEIAMELPASRHV